MDGENPRILVGFDGSPESRVALTWALDYARAANGQVRALAVWQWPNFLDAAVGYATSNPESLYSKALRRALDDLRSTATDVTAEIAEGRPGPVLVEKADDADLLVVGTHGAGAVTRLILGSVSTYCATHARRPVAIVRATPPGRRGVLVGLDDSADARVALDWAIDYAELTRQPLKLLHVVELPAPQGRIGYPLGVAYPHTTIEGHARRWIDGILEETETRHRLPSDLSVEISSGNAAARLVQRSSDVAVTVCGRRGVGGFRRLLFGSVVAALAHHGESTVVVTPPK